MTLSPQSNPLQVVAGGHGVLAIRAAGSPMSRDCEDSAMLGVA